MKLIDPRLLRQAKSSRLALGLSIALGFAGGVFTVIQAWLFSRVIDGVFLGGVDLRNSTPLLVLLLLIFLGRAVALWAGEISAKSVALNVKTFIRNKLYAHIQKLGPLYTRGERTGELVNTATEGIEALDAYFSEYIPQLVLAALLPFTFLFFIFPLDRLSGLVLLLTGPLIPVFMVLIGDRADAITKRQWRTLSRMSAHFLDVLQGLTTLKLLGRSRSQIHVIRQVSEGFRARTMDVLRVAFLSALVLEMVATLSTAVVAVEIGLRLLYGRLAFEQAIFILLLAPEFYLPLRLLGTRFHAGVAGVTAAGRIFEILNDGMENNLETSDKGVKETSSTPPVPDCSITFDSVSYSYTDGQTALQDISFKIEPGEKIALVGPSGAGKSTIAALLLGWIEPDSGQILGRMSAAKSAWLPQNPYLFHDTIAANIRIARPEASMDQVIDAAKAAQAHEFIIGLEKSHYKTTWYQEKKHKELSVPVPSHETNHYPGYNTFIGERGALLSSGQAQRIALARAFLMEAPFVILDEPTTHLDPELESQVINSLDNLLEDRSALIIAHRINTVKGADKIIVLNEGRIVQQGTYHELLTQDGLFRNMVTVADKHRPQTVEKLLPTTSPPAPLPFQPPVSIPNFPHKSPSTLYRLLSFLRPYLGWVALSILLGFLTITSSIGLMGTSAFIISAAALQPSIALLQVPIVGVRFFGISRGLFRYLERLTSHQTTFRVLASLRIWFYKQLEPLAPAHIQQHHSAELLSTIVGNINTLENFFIRVVAPPLTAFTVAIFTGLFINAYAPRLAVVFWLFMSLAGILLPLWTFRLARGLGAEVLKSSAALSTTLVDGLQGLPDLLVFGRGPDQFQLIQELGNHLIQIQARYSRLSGLGTALMNLSTNLGMWTVLVLAIPLVISGQIEGVFLATIALVAYAGFEALQPLPMAAQYLDANLRAASDIFAIVDTAPEVAPPLQPQPIPDDKTLIIQDLAFSYSSPPSDRPPAHTYLSTAIKTSHHQQSAVSEPSPFRLHLSDISIPPGKRIAIVGPSGSGKTTLLNLMLRFWDFQDGKITLGGQDIRVFNPDVLRCQYSVVSQHTYLFNTSLRENLLIAKPNATETEIYSAAQNAQIHDFIRNLPDGYETFIGEQGLRLSGGERQRIAIARALIRDTPILILDEPTSHLYPYTEWEVLTAIHMLMKDRSTLLVTHRLVGMEWMDEILVLKEGRIIERGGHAQLLDRGGLYSRMWEIQRHQFD